MAQPCALKTVGLKHFLNNAAIEKQIPAMFESIVLKSNAFLMLFAATF